MFCREGEKSACGVLGDCGEGVEGGDMGKLGEAKGDEEGGEEEEEEEDEDEEIDEERAGDTKEFKEEPAPWL